jgi:hypothetical protein
MHPVLILLSCYAGAAILVATVVLIFKHFQKQGDAWNEGYNARGTLDFSAVPRYNNQYKQRYRARAYDRGFNYRQKQRDKQEAIRTRNLDRAVKKGIFK